MPPGLSKDEVAKHCKCVYRDPDPDQHFHPGGCFERVVTDEAHVVKNLAKQTWVTMRWLALRYQIAVTATPLVNKDIDFAGLIGMIEPDPSVIWSDTNLAWLHVKSNVDTFSLPRTHPAAYLRATSMAVKRFVLAKG